MSKRFRSRTRILLKKTKQLVKDVGSSQAKRRLKKDIDDFEEYSERVASFMKKLEGPKWLKARDLMSRRIKSNTRKLLKKTKQLLSES